MIVDVVHLTSTTTSECETFGGEPELLAAYKAGQFREWGNFVTFHCLLCSTDDGQQGCCYEIAPLSKLPRFTLHRYSSLCSRRQSASQLQLDHDTTALPGVLINWHYHRHSLHTACMLEIELAMQYAGYMYGRIACSATHHLIVLYSCRSRIVCFALPW